MSSYTRRDAMKLAAMSGPVAMSPFALGQDAQQPGGDVDSLDRKRVLAAGMTEAEADCWEFAAKTAGAFFALPELHSMDAHEIAHAIHVVQNKLLARPTYRRYLEEAKKQQSQ